MAVEATCDLRDLPISSRGIRADLPFQRPWLAQERSVTPGAGARWRPPNTALVGESQWPLRPDLGPSTSGYEAGTSPTSLG